VQRIAVRCRQQNGQWAVGVLLSTLSPRDVLGLTGQPLSLVDDPVAVLLAYIIFYDQCGGRVETTFKGDKGVGMTKRNKKRFEAQQMVMLLGTLAHNVIISARRWLFAPQARLRPYGIVRMVRDVFHISGFLVWDASGQLVQIVLNQAAPLASVLLISLRELLAPAYVALSLGQT
jgi:hypothetical protein